MVTWILWKYWRNISRYFHKNMDKTKIIQKSWKYLKKLQKNDKINKKTYIKVIL